MVTDGGTVASDSSLTRFNRSIANFESLSKSMAGYMERNQSKLDKTTDNFLTASGELKEMMANNRSSIDSTVARFDRVSGNLDRFVIQLDSISTSFRTFADALENEDGTLQLMVEDRRLYDDLRQAADNLDDLINDIRANPRKYINLKVELF